MLDFDTAIQLWQLVLGTKFKHLNSWCEYLKSHYKKSITKDTWMLTYDFGQQANEDMSNIDLANSAWPVVIDEVRLDGARVCVCVCVCVQCVCVHVRT